MNIKLDIDTSGVTKMLNRIEENARQRAAHEALDAGAQVFVGHIRKNIDKQGLRKRGKLINSVRVGKHSGTSVEFGSYGVIYAAVHEFGATIRAKSARALSWVTDTGQRVFAKVVRIPARPYFRPALDENKAEALKAMEAKLKQIIWS